MVTPSRPPDPFRAIVAIFCLWELAALHDSSPLPTWSHIFQTVSKRRLRVAWITWAWSGFWALHFFGLDRPLLDWVRARIRQVTH